MCKCCQSIFDSCYWHCYAKWQFDEDIALYQDEASQEKDPRAIDNIAFWDSVSIIASRSAIMTQPIDKPPRRQFSIPRIPKTPTKTKPKVTIKVESPDVVDSSNISNINIMDTSNLSYTEVTISDASNLTDEEKSKNIDDGKMEFEKKKSRKKSLIEEKIEKKFLVPETERVRKQSLQKRRNSTVDLTIEIPKIDSFHEVPNVIQSNIPSHYEKWTPEDNPFMRPDIGSSILVSPILAKTPQYDLESIVMEVNHCTKAMENEKSNQKASMKTSIRMENIRRKIKPILIKKQPSTKSLPDLANHM